MDEVMLPKEYAERMKALLGEEGFEAYAGALRESPKRAFHLNRLKVSKADFKKLSPFGEEKIPGYNNGFFFDYPHIGSHPYHHAGMIYVQEPGAMFPLEGINITPGMNILDLCSAPGGKASQAAQALGGTGHLVANEIIPSRCKTLTGNMERLGYANATVTSAPAGIISSAFGSVFDLVITDAPCSGEGMFRKNPEAIAEWTAEKVKICAERQAEILNEGAKLVKPGGYLLYSTCTFSPEENELTVEAFIEKHPRFELRALDGRIYGCTTEGISTKKDTSLCRRFYPHTGAGEGQFAALMQNTGDAVFKAKAASALRMMTAKERDAVLPFLKDTLTQFDEEKIFMHGDSAVFTDTPSFSPAKISYMTGVTIGQMKNGRLNPHHQLFSAMGKEMQHIISLAADDDKTARYLKGESFEWHGENGWYAVQIDGCPAGGARVVNGYAKNRYPRGLQNLL